MFIICAPPYRSVHFPCTYKPFHPVYYYSRLFSASLCSLIGLTLSKFSVILFLDSAFLAVHSEGHLLYFVLSAVLSAQLLRISYWTSLTLQPIEPLQSLLFSC